MTTARARCIADLLEVHAEDLAFLWGQRREALYSRRHTLRELGELNERIEAHLQGLLIAGPVDLPALLQPRLVSVDRDEAFAGAYGLLRLGEAGAIHAVLVEFSRATGATLAGLRDALTLAPPAPFAAEMQSALDKAKPATAVSAAVVLANHRLLDAASPRLAGLLEDADPPVATLAWRVAASVDAAARPSPPRRSYRLALSHADAAVRDAGWLAAAWAGKAAALTSLRQLAGAGATDTIDGVGLRWLAVLGAGEDAGLLQNAVLAIEDPAERCAILARHGHPSALETLLGWMGHTDLALAAAAGEAFERITGADIRGERRTLPVPDSADEFAREMALQVWLPDPAKARALLERHAAEWAAGSRWCRGRRLDGEVGRELLPGLDLEARWDVAVRAALAKQFVAAPPPVH